jgi:hypothetical protein
MAISKVTDRGRHEWQAREFVAAGVQYYIAARAAALAGLMPVSGNLFHHAFEMILKAGVITHNVTMPFATSQRTLRNLGHDLKKIWNAFQVCYPGDTLGAFDPLIADLNRWEDIRYPDPNRFTGAAGIAMSVVHRRGEHPSAKSPSGKTVEYYLRLEECDELVKTLWQVLDFTPSYFRTFLLMRELAKNLYAEDNLHRIDV